MKSKLILTSLLLLGLILAILLVSQTAIFSGRANSSSSKIPVKENSYLFASPIQAKADSKEKIRITVFLLDSNGLGVSQQNVKLNTPSQVFIDPIQPTTDEFGKAIFDINSATPGKYQISASTSTLNLGQKINVLFLE